MSAPDSMEEKLLALRQKYVRKLPQRLQNLYQHWELLESKYEILHVDKIYRIVHQLTGSGKTYGFPAISETARLLEIKFYQLRKEKTTSLSSEEIKLIKEWISEFDKACQEAIKQCI